MTTISGYGDNLTINGTRIGDLSPKEHENIEKKKGGQNYSPLENVVVSHVKDSSTLICRKPSKDSISNYVEEELLDGLCCYSAVNQGQLNKTIVDAVISHLRDEKLPTVPRSIRHKYMSAFLLASTSFTEMDRVVPKVAGVESWELTFKLCRRWGYHVKKIPNNECIVVGATGNFHGRSLAAVSMSDDPDSKHGFGPFVPGIELVPFNDFDVLKNLFETKGDRIAAFSVEPIQGEAGVIVPDDDYWPRVQKLCKKHNILLAFDEVQTGFGRTGANFAHQLYNVKPDIMGCGKAAGGGILPVSFVAGRDDVIGTLTPGSEGSTFGGYPLASVVGIYAIKTLIEENLAENAKIRGKQLMKNFNDIMNDFPDKIKEVRGKGLLRGIKVKVNNVDFLNQLFENKMLAVKAGDNAVRLLPPLIIENKEIDEGVSIIEKVCEKLK